MTMLKLAPSATVDRVAIARAAWDLISKGAASIDEGALAMLHARVVSFWRGDEYSKSICRFLSRTRIPLKLGPGTKASCSPIWLCTLGNS